VSMKRLGRIDLHPIKSIAIIRSNGLKNPRISSLLMPKLFATATICADLAEALVAIQIVGSRSDKRKPRNVLRSRIFRTIGKMYWRMKDTTDVARSEPALPST
jgi:hypothetical protein